MLGETGGEGQWRILTNGTTVIGLFAEHIEQNILTFNPGLAQTLPASESDDEPAMPEPIEGFTDVRVIEARLKAAGIELDRPTETPEGPDHILLKDPDGNVVMVDQFF